MTTATENNHVPGQHWTRAKVLDAIRRRYQAGLSLKSKQVPNDLKLAARRRFGSWEVALQMASLNYDEITSRRQWTREKVIAEIRKLEADRVPLNSSWIKGRYGDLYRAAIRLFPSSWGNALQAAGLDPFEHKKRRVDWTRKRAESWLQTRIDKGQSLRRCDAPSDLRDFIVYALKTTWISFVESFGVAYPGGRKRVWSKELVLDEIRRWAAEGRRTNHRTVWLEYQILTVQARKYYGSWDAARTAAGVPLDRGPAPPPAAGAPVVAETLCADAATAADRAPAQRPAVKASVASPSPRFGSASRVAEQPARHASARSHEPKPPPIRSPAATGPAARRLPPAGSPPPPRDPILAFLARGGLDEVPAEEAGT